MKSLTIAIPLTTVSTTITVTSLEMAKTTFGQKSSVLLNFVKKSRKCLKQRRSLFVANTKDRFLKENELPRSLPHIDEPTIDQSAKLDQTLVKRWMRKWKVQIFGEKFSWRIAWLRKKRQEVHKNKIVLSMFVPKANVIKSSRLFLFTFLPPRNCVESQSVVYGRNPEE